MILECPDFPLSSVASMQVRWYQLEGCFPFERDGLFVRCAGLVVQDSEVNRQATGRETRHDRVVGCDLMHILFEFDGLLQDEVAILVVRDHDVLVARLGSYREATGVIRIQFADWVRAHEEQSLFILGRRWHHRG